MPLGFDSYPLLLVSFALTAVAVGVALRRRVALPRWSQILGLVSLVLWSGAAGGMHWRQGERREVVVMVDLSPSTRTARFRDRADLDRRLAELLGDVPRRVVLFADGHRADDGAALAEMPCDRTVYAPPADAARVLLFSDGQFELPTVGPPVYAVIDPALEAPVDAAVTGLQTRGDKLIADVGVAGNARKLTVEGAATTMPVNVDAGAFTLSLPMKSGAAHFTASFDAGDAWPENDALVVDEPPRVAAERWWVGGAPPAGWKALASLPTREADYLAPAVIVLNDVSADSLGTSAVEHLDRYVRDFGGSLILLGGEHAFGAGGWGVTPLESLSPLASTPPEPATRWVILVDGSGSMAGATPDGATRWELAGRAVKGVLPHLPPNDTISVGSFAAAVTWWSSGRRVADTAALTMPPDAVAPNGPTNLQRALRDVSGAAGGAMPTRLLVVTDGEAAIDDPAGLAVEMKAKRCALSVLAIGSGSALPALRQIADATGGRVSAALDAGTWSARLDDLARGRADRGLEVERLRVTFDPSLRLAAGDKARWDRTWLKDRATALAAATVRGQTVHPVATWQVGNGRVLAASFDASGAEAEAFAALVARPPADLRYAVTWQQGAALRVTVDAVDSGAFLNGKALRLKIRGESQLKGTDVPQVAPGKYAVTVDPPRIASFAAVREGGRVLSQIALAGRYAPEFDAVGNDHAALHELARRTGGEVVDWRKTTPVDWHWSTRNVPLGSWLLMAGTVCLCAALAWWRLN